MVWKTVLRVPTKDVREAMALLVSKRRAIEKAYAKIAKGLAPVKIVGFEARARSIVMAVKGEDIRVNLVSDSIAAVLPSDTTIRLPYWG
jgi:vacuolar-type H+-ATPase subunit D/Vma8